MFCMKCGKELENDSKFCISCGTPVNGQETAANPNAIDTDPTPSGFAAAATSHMNMSFGPAGSAMAPGPINMLPDYTPEELELLQKGWNLCKLALFLPFLYGIAQNILPLPAMPRYIALFSSSLLCIDKSYLGRVGLPLSKWYYLAIFLCPAIYLYRREKLTGHRHFFSYLFGGFYLLGILVFLLIFILGRLH